MISRIFIGFTDPTMRDLQNTTVLPDLLYQVQRIRFQCLNRRTNQITKKNLDPIATKFKNKKLFLLKQKQIKILTSLCCN